MEKKYKYKVFAERGDEDVFESKLEYKGNNILKALKTIIQLKIRRIYCISVELY